MKACFLILAAVVAVAWAEAPYPAAGYQPARAFLLPVRQPYRAYQQAYQVYGAPAATTTPEPEAETVESTTEPQEEESTTEEASEVTTQAAGEPEGAEDAEAAAGEDEDAESRPVPLYYIVVPGDAREQRVLYTPQLAQYQAAYSAGQYQDFQTGPYSALYAYAGPLTRILRR